MHSWWKLSQNGSFIKRMFPLLVSSQHLHLALPRPLGVWRSQLRCEKGKKRPGRFGVRQVGRGGGAVGLPEGAERSATEYSAAGSRRSRCWPVVLWKLHVCRLLRAGGTPGGGGRNVFRSPVILHNAGQIRLELTAEDIQLDCACHSVASIRARARVFVFPVAEREKAARSVSVSFPFMSLDFFIVCITDHYMLNIDWAASTSNAHRSPFGRPNIDSPQSAHQGFRCQIKIPKFLLHPYKQVNGDHSFYSFLLIFFLQGNQQHMQQ